MNTCPARGGLRPTGPDLPPTLLPHAIAAAAPPADRARSAALAACVYLVLAGASVSLSRVAAAHVGPTRREPEPGHTILIENPAMLPPKPVAPPVMPTLPPGFTSTLPAGAFLPVPSEVPPENPTSGLPTENRALGLPAYSGPAVPQALGPAGTGTYTGPVVQQTTMESLRILQRVDPVYPTFARLGHVQGAVVLAMTIDERGVPVDVQVLEGHRALQAEALRVARLWRFEPASQDGRPVSASFRLTLKFTLK